jgi:hypothetical protein
MKSDKRQYGYGFRPAYNFKVNQRLGGLNDNDRADRAPLIK